MKMLSRVQGMGSQPPARAAGKRTPETYFLAGGGRGQGGARAMERDPQVSGNFPGSGGREEQGHRTRWGCAPRGAVAPPPGPPSPVQMATFAG